MILELLLKPVTSTKKLINTMTQNMLIGLSIAVPLLIALIPAFVVKQKLSSVLGPLGAIGGMYDESIGKGASTLVDAIGTSIFKFIFGKILLFAIIITAVLFLGLIVFYNIKKIAITPKQIWQAMTTSGIQIVYYLVIAGLLSFMSAYFAVVALLGIINAIICLEVTLSEGTGAAINAAGSAQSFENIPAYNPAPQTAESEVASTVDLEKKPLTVNEPAPVIFTAQNAQNGPSVPLTERFKALNKGQKKLLISLASVVVVVGIAFFVGNSLTSKEHVSQKLAQAIKNNDINGMAKYLTSSDSRLKINQNTLKGYADFLKDNPSYTSELLEAIDKLGKSSDDTASSSLINLTKSGKKFVFFNNYVYQLPAYFIKVQTQLKNTAVLLNGEVVYTADKDNQQKECGPYLPGKYSLDADLKADYSEVKGHKDIILDPKNISSKIFTTDIPLEGQRLSLYSNYKDAKIIINGKDTGVTVDEVEKLIPLPNDGSCKVQLSNKFPWGEMKSQEIAFGKNSMNFNFDKGNTALVDSIKPVITEFLKSYVDAYTAYDPSKLLSITDRYKQSATDDLNYKKYYNYAFTGSLKSATLDPQSLNLNYNSYNANNYTVSFNVALSGDFSQSGNLYFNNNSYNISLVYDTTQNKWLVDSFYGSWYSSKITNGTEIEIK